MWFLGHIVDTVSEKSEQDISVWYWNVLGTVSFWGLQNEMLGSTREGEILPSSSTKRREELLGRVVLTWRTEKLPTDWISFCTEQKTGAVRRNIIVLLSWSGNYTKSPRLSIWVDVYSYNTYLAERSCCCGLNKRQTSCETAFITIEHRNRTTRTSLFFCFYNVMWLLYLRASFVQN